MIRLIFVVSMMTYADAMRKVEVSEGYEKLGEKVEGERELEIKIGNEIRNFKLAKRSMVAPSRPSHQNAKTDVYEAPDYPVICMEECTGNANCESRCLLETGTEYVYAKESKVLLVQNDEEIVFSSTDTLKGLQELLKKKSIMSGSGLDQRGKGKREKRNVNKRSLPIPNIQTDTAIVKLRFMIDVAFLQRFIDFVDTGDLQDAKDEIEFFITLLINRVNLYYRALNELGLSFNSTDNVTFPLDFAFCVESVVYPTQNEDGTFSDLDLIVANRKDGFLITDIFTGENNIFTDVGGLVVDFSEYMYDLFQGVPQPFDLVHFLTGDDLGFDFYDTSGGEPVFVGREKSSGIAAIGALCYDFSPLTEDRRFGFSAYNIPPIGRIVAHELGHNLGAYHDIGPECPANASTVMAAFPPPVTADLTEYYQWSACSRREFAEYFSIFSSETLTTCCYRNKPTNFIEEFREKFCAGILGQTYGLDDQCRLLFGNDSFLCSDGDANFENGYVAFGQCVTALNVTTGEYPPIFRCAMDNSCSGSTNGIKQLLDGTKCRYDESDDEDRICFEKICQTVGEVCDDDDDDDDDDGDDESDDESSSESSEGTP